MWHRNECPIISVLRVSQIHVDMLCYHNYQDKGHNMMHVWLCNTTCCSHEGLRLLITIIVYD